MRTSMKLKETALEPRQRNQSLNQAITYQGSHQVQADISTTDAAPVKRGYPVIDRRALKFAQIFAAMQESEWSYQSAVHYLKLAYGFPSEAPASPIQLGGAKICITTSQSKSVQTSPAASAYTWSGKLKANRPVREDEYIASLLGFMEIAEMAGYKITAPEEMQNASR